MTAIRILADDLTGALDTAAAFAGNVPVYIDRPPAARDGGDCPVSVVATPTRDVPPEALAGLLDPAVEWFASAGLPFKKVDSLLRGNTFVEIAWLFRRGRFSRVIFAPAFPAQGRITVEDRQWVVRPGQAREAVSGSLVQAFEAFGLRAGSMFDENAAIWIPAVATDGDFDRLVAQAHVPEGKVMWAGSAGLGHALSRHLGLSPRAGTASPLPAGPGPTVMVSASFQPVFREQWARLRGCRPAAVVAEGGESARIAEAIDAVRAGANEAWFDLSPRETMAPAEATRRLETTARLLVEKLPRPGRLIVVGGDTLLGLCRASGANGLLAYPALRPGWGCARLMGGAWDGVPCYSRSGAFGAADDLVALYGALDHKTSC